MQILFLCPKLFTTNHFTLWGTAQHVILFLSCIISRLPRCGRKLAIVSSLEFRWLLWRTWVNSGVWGFSDPPSLGLQNFVCNLGRAAHTVFQGAYTVASTLCQSFWLLISYTRKSFCWWIHMLKMESGFNLEIFKACSS